MPYSIDKYGCSFCNSEFDTIKDVLECEKHGEPKEGGEFDEGDEITYQNQDVSGKMEVLTNKIILKMIRNINGRHTWVYIVEQNLLGIPTHEKAVIQVEGIWYGPIGMTYKIGYSKIVKEMIEKTKIKKFLWNI